MPLILSWEQRVWFNPGEQRQQRLHGDAHDALTRLGVPLLKATAVACGQMKILCPCRSARSDQSPWHLLIRPNTMKSGNEVPKLGGKAAASELDEGSGDSFGCSGGSLRSALALRVPLKAEWQIIKRYFHWFALGRTGVSSFSIKLKKTS